MSWKVLTAMVASALLASTAIIWSQPKWRYLLQSQAVFTVERLTGLPLHPAPSLSSTPWATDLINSAASQIGVTVNYDPAYVALSYPNGDIPRRDGVCTDVVIRALRDAHQIDLQERVHQDMSARFASYPNHWGLTRPDSNIDHRRVPNLRRYFEHIGAALPAPTLQSDFQPGDIITWKIAPGRPHIGIVSDRTSRDGSRPLILHNAGLGTRLDDFLPLYPMTGHYRLEGHL
ncbi:DUF1287 domain-containing protein [Shimia sp. R11_0]|uniref:DUF1287 domain-containing protein n=1 Tax=Shimia sp. R11_0 TaxID=2821096 RepID=UPI001ADA3C44|nr:DUF1287 domain-containing protein [Shimia sp. R11_0]